MVARWRKWRAEPPTEQLAEPHQCVWSVADLQAAARAKREAENDTPEPKVWFWDGIHEPRPWP